MTRVYNDDNELMMSKKLHLGDRVIVQIKRTSVCVVCVCLCVCVCVFVCLCVFVFVCVCV